MAQLALPVADTFNGGWITAPLWSKIDEGSAGGGDATVIEESTTTAWAVVELGAVTDPVSSSGHILRMRWGKLGTAGPATAGIIELRQGYVNESSQGTLRATFTGATAEGAFLNETYTLSGAEADSITDYSDLFLRFQYRAADIDYLEFEVPDAPSGGEETSTEFDGGGSIGPASIHQAAITTAVAGGGSITFAASAAEPGSTSTEFDGGGSLSTTSEGHHIAEGGSDGGGGITWAVTSNQPNLTSMELDGGGDVTSSVEGAHTTTLEVSGGGRFNPIAEGGASSGNVLAPGIGQVLKWFEGGLIDVRVEVDTGLSPETVGGVWGTALWDDGRWGDSDPSWFDLSAYVMGINIAQGTERWGRRMTAGSCSITVDNTSGIFTPGSSAPAPWLLPFRPGRRIRVVAVPDPDAPTAKVPLFTGKIDSAKDTLSEAGFNLATTLVCLDFMEDWHAHNPPALSSPTGVQDTHERVEAALDEMGWDAALRDIQTGAHTMQTSDLAQTTLEECQRAADAEGGAFFCSKDGKATFKARDWLTTDTRSTTLQGYIGYDQLPEGEQSGAMVAVSPSWELARIVNDVQFARVGGTLQREQDASSQAVYGIRSYPRSDFQNTTDAEVLFLAERHLAAFKDNRMRIDRVTIAPNRDPDNDDLNRLLWDSQLGDLVTIRVRPPFGWEVEQEAHIMGISHSITAEDWEVTFQLDDASLFT